MPSLDLNTAAEKHVTRVVIEPGAAARAGSYVEPLRPSKVLLVSETTVAPLLADKVLASLRSAGLDAEGEFFSSGEASKSPQVVEVIHGRLAAMALGRDGVIVALGGGVVSDVAGFAAATWMRGVRFVICPTTMEAMLDASIGGKTGINLPAGKNLVGAFHHPSLVLIDPTTLNTLPPRDVRAGLAESIKHALVFDEAFVGWHEANVECVLKLEPGAVTELIHRNVRIKADVVAADPYERTGRRALLNFGHTIGHALEAECGYALRHGECVAMGMAAALSLSVRCAGLAADQARRGRQLIEAFGLPVRWSACVAASQHIDPHALLERTRTDKKNAAGRRRFVLVEAIGRAKVVDDVDDESLQEAIREVLT
ncbi:MAG: 3-dehydroquinate synthase [Phycisphaerales bacterium]|nr:3-dehydroquinate synthase [Phycisphaerales bacterium]